MFRTSHLLLALAIVTVTCRAVHADDEGKVAYNNHCRTCHSIRMGDNRLGPSIIGIIGAEAGQVSGYRSYSGSLKGFVWDEAKLDAFMADPTAVASGTTMIFPPVSDATVRAKIIGFLKSTSGP